MNIKSQKTTLSQLDLNVKDGRIDDQLYLVAISSSGTHTYILNPNIHISESIDNSVSSSLANHKNKEQINIIIDVLDLKAQISFLGDHKLLCVMESKVSIGSKDHFIVKTLSKNNETSSSQVGKIGEAILTQCLKEHSDEIANGIKNYENW